MVFSSLIFIFLFLPITIFLYYISPKKLKNLTILIASLIFYAWGEPICILLMVFSIILNYIMTLFIHNFRYNKNISRNIFIVTLAINLGMLAFFKYFSFIIDNLNMLLGLNIIVEKIPLPMGISFYTFQILSYVIDVYLDKVEVQRNIINFGVYVTMFPQLVAGPIVKYSDINYQLKNRKRSLYKFSEGIERFIIGLGKKVLIANNIGIIWTNIKSLDISSLSILSSWLGIIAFTLQIYFDFSGYSDMAIGLGKMFGFEFMENFNYPYIAKSVSEFWRRWHISLGQWFREYIYIPLGGNRVNLITQFRNLFIVWFTTGLWHGASWNFVFWGLYFGFFIFLEKIFLGRFLKGPLKFISNLYTILVVIIGWVFFDIDKLGLAFSYLKVMFGFKGNPFIDKTFIYYFYTNFFLLIIGILCATPLVSELYTKLKQTRNFKVVLFINLTLCAILFLSTAYLVNQSFNPFLYFRF
ncbi:MBOAT family protein [Haloimpatiens sp. FM7315]|uniref:MBOAT family O-acyltransferase n=1 Tax=Haloimpatiens sp. FM7315 TaxID=3298609 RepID=UPI0035A2B7F7